MAQDLKEKRARFIDRNNELCQEFFFAHPETKLRVNDIYNCHFTGSPLWDLFSPEAIQFEKTWNVCFRIMFGLPRETHCYFVESITQKPHLKTILIERFLNFTIQIANSEKIALKNVFNFIKNDARSTTGKNLRSILLLLDKNDIDDLSPQDASKILYKEVPENELWRIALVKELIDIRQGVLEVEGFSEDELVTILNYTCTS